MAVARDLSAVALHPADRKAGHPSETRAGAIGRFPDAGASPVQTAGTRVLQGTGHVTTLLACNRLGKVVTQL